MQILATVYNWADGMSMAEVETNLRTGQRSLVHGLGHEPVDQEKSARRWLLGSTKAEIGQGCDN